MRKLVILFLVMMAVGCGNRHGQQEAIVADSTLLEVDENHVVIYNMLTGKDEIMEVSHDIPDGSIKIDSNGDTLFWLGGDTTGQGKYLASKEWKAYCREMEEFYRENDCREQEEFYKKFR